jgi:hypothetical protein
MSSRSVPSMQDLQQAVPPAQPRDGVHYAMTGAERRTIAPAAERQGRMHAPEHHRCPPNIADESSNSNFRNRIR